MSAFLSNLILRLAGYRVTGGLPPEIKKCVIIVAPHTSNWDFVLGRLGFFKLKIKAKFLIKKEFFKFPFKYVLRYFGGIPVNRQARTHLIETCVQMFNERDEFFLVITPEGTRSYTEHWKKGFYRIATNAGVPIAFGFIDYKKKRGGIDGYFYPSGNFEEDFAKIEAFASTITPRYPKKFNLSPCYTKK